MEGQVSFTQAFGNEFEKQENCDVLFEIDGETIGAHKLMLKVRCQGLYDIVKRSDDKPIEIEDIDFRSFRNLLRYIYSDEIPLAENNVSRYLFAATKYKMEHLEHRCVDFISKFISEKNLWMYMNEALNSNSKILLDRCRHFFSKETGRCSADQSFLKLSQPALCALLDVEQTNVSETVLFLCIRKWMEHQCQGEGLPINGENMRQVLGDALFKIRFPTMAPEEFANLVSTINGFLTVREMSKTFQVISVTNNRDITCPFSRINRCRPRVSINVVFAIG